MPFTASSAPPDVKRRFKGECLEVWARVWNETYERHNDEGRAFATAETAGQQCKQSRKAEDSTVDMAVKFSEGSDTEIRGLAIPFNGPVAGKDFDGESFGPDTDLHLDWFDTRPLLYHHGLNGSIKSSRVGRQVEVETDDEGVWVKAELDKRSRYYNRVKQLVDAGAVSFSSGALPHLVRTSKDGRIESWPWVELSLTPTPANPAAVVYAVKAAPEAAFEDLNDPSAEVAQPTYAEQTEQVLASLKAWVDASVDRAEFRAKIGRELSRANLDALREAHRILDELIRRASDKDEPDEEKVAAEKRVREEFLRLESRLYGVPI